MTLPTRRCSSRQFIPRIRVDTLVLQARNDPFSFSDTAPGEEELPGNVWLEIPDAGGHVGFVSGAVPGFGRYYAEQRVADWLAQGLDTP